jgi:hypothetical protein
MKRTSSSISLLAFAATCTSTRVPADDPLGGNPDIFSLGVTWTF